MSLARSFHASRKQVRQFTNLIVALDAPDAIVASSKTGTQLAIDSATHAIVKASLMVMLYNLVESTIVQSVSYILESTSKSKTSYDSLTDEIRKYWMNCRIRAIRESSNEKWVDALDQLILSAINNLPAESIDEKIIRKGFLGNLDGRKAREEISSFGIKTVFSKSSREGSDLLKIKKDRNDLAHGIYSFEEIGRKYTTQELREISIRTQRFLLDLVNSIDDFVFAKRYANSAT